MPNFHSFENFPKIVNPAQFSESIPLPPRSIASYPQGKSCLAFFEIPGTSGRFSRDIIYLRGEISNFDQREGDSEGIVEVRVHQSNDRSLMGTNIRIGSRNILVFHDPTSVPNLN